MVWLLVTATVVTYGGVMKYVLDHTSKGNKALILKK